MKKRIQFISLSAISGTRYDDETFDRDYNTFFTPYSVGLLHSYINSDEEVLNLYDINENYIFQNKKNIEDYESEIDWESDIFCFSTYMWNEKRHLKIAKMIKEKKKDSIIIFGGQNIQINPNQYTIDFLKKNNHIDILVHGQGEPILLQILKNMNSLKNINNISFIQNNEIIINPIIKIKADQFKKGVSPYYPKFLFQNMKKYADNNNQILTYLVETNRGCPFECVFCEWGKALGNSLIKINDIDFIKKEIKIIIENMRTSKYSRGIFIIDSNFGIIKRDIEILNEIIIQKKKNDIDNLFFSKCDSKIVTEHSIEIEKIIQKEKISSHKILALQTSNLETLKNIKRPHVNKSNMVEIRKKVKYKNEDRSKNSIEFIFSLPGGYNYQKYLTDLDYLIDTNPYAFYQAYICFAGINTEIREPEYSEKWRIKTETFPIFDIDENVESSKCIVSTDSFTREDFAKMFKMNIVWKLLKNDKPFNILSNVIIYLHRNKVMIFSEFIEKFLDFIINNKTYIYKKNRNLFKYIDMLSQGYYTKNEDKRIKRKFFAKLVIDDFQSYLKNIIDFINLYFEDKKLNLKLLKILQISLMFIRNKGEIIIDSAGWESYGMHGIYYLNVINVNLKNIIKKQYIKKITKKNDILKLFT